VTAAMPQLSLTVGMPRFTSVATFVPGLGRTERSAGQMIVGGWLSSTVTVKVQLFVLPLASVAVEVTVVVPTGKTEPLKGVLVRFVTAPQMSVAVTLKVTLLVHRPEVALTVMFPGQMIVGGCVSRTVTVKEQLFVLPLASVAVEVTVVVPTGKEEPLEGILATTGVPAQLSVAVTLKVTFVEH